MDGSTPPDAQWPEHLRRLCLRLAPPAGNASETDRGEAWIAIRDALTRFLRRRAGRFGGASVEDLEDLASTKALDLLSRAESGEWRLDGRSAGEVAGYLSRVAHNALIDHLKRRGRLISESDLGHDMDSDLFAARPTEADAARATDAPVLAHEFIGSLRDCLVELQPRSRRVWFFRTFYGMSSKAIARHPDVMLQAAHVDVVLQRARNAIRACMGSKGFEPRDMPAGAFAEVWEFLESLRDEARTVSEPEAEVR